MSEGDTHLKLSPREAEVCDLMVLGLRTKEIARRLGIGPRTVDDYRDRILAKHNARNVIHLVHKVLSERGVA